MRIASCSGRRPGDLARDHQVSLKDDVMLEGDALAVLLDTACTVGRGKVVVGAVRVSDRGSTTAYSGRRARALPEVEPAGRSEICDTYNGNVVQFLRTVYERAGDIDRVLQHGIGDFDHGFRSRQHRIPAHVMPCRLAICDRNPPHTGSCEPGVEVREALRRVTSPRELPPRPWWGYCLRRPWAPLLMVSPYVKTAARSSGRRPPAGE